MINRRTVLSLVAVAMAGCIPRSAGQPTPYPVVNGPVGPSPVPSAPIPIPPTAVPPTPRPPAIEPLGFPIDPAFRLGEVIGRVGSRTIDWGVGPTAFDYSRDDQPANDPVRANRCGWNARVHVAYEGQPAVDWYLPTGTPVRATMDGTATLAIVSTGNPFETYRVSREPFIGNPDRARAPVNPFPGPNGGQGVFVRVANDRFQTTYAHLDLALTLPAIPADSFLPGFGPDPAIVSRFSALRNLQNETEIARWSVRRGDLLGLSGDTGYSEAPHLHYTIRRTGPSGLLCPTAEAGFPDNGWLLKQP